MVPIDSEESLANDLRDDKLIQRELSQFAGYLVLKAGRLVALVSALLQVAKHVDINELTVKKSEIKEEASEEIRAPETN